MQKTPRLSVAAYAAVAVGVIVALAATLLLMGRVPWCECGVVKLWHGQVISPENSQHIADWYSPSHMIHGILFYAGLTFIARRVAFDMPVAARFIGAVAIESAWEIFENTSFVINRYREATIALDYFGDSVLNSVSDVLFMSLGFGLAARLPIWVTVALILGMEIFVGFFIRDNLALNVIMLLYPVEAIKTWQMGV